MQETYIWHHYGPPIKISMGGRGLRSTNSGGPRNQGWRASVEVVTDGTNPWILYVFRMALDGDRFGGFLDLCVYAEQKVECGEPCKGPASTITSAASLAPPQVCEQGWWWYRTQRLSCGSAHAHGYEERFELAFYAVEGWPKRNARRGSLLVSWRQYQCGLQWQEQVVEAEAREEAIEARQQFGGSLHRILRIGISGIHDINFTPSVVATSTQADFPEFCSTVILLCPLYRHTHSASGTEDHDQTANEGAQLRPYALTSEQAKNSHKLRDKCLSTYTPETIVNANNAEVFSGAARAVRCACARKRGTVATNVADTTAIMQRIARVHADTRNASRTQLYAIKGGRTGTRSIRGAEFETKTREVLSTVIQNRTPAVTMSPPASYPLSHCHANPWTNIPSNAFEGTTASGMACALVQETRIDAWMDDH
ncbi:hypothetical protein V8E53_006900 [Lactarius tabidus]